MDFIEWHQRYILALMKNAGFSQKQAEDILYKADGLFDYGYSPEWYVREELNCGGIKRKDY